MVSDATWGGYGIGRCLLFAAFPKLTGRVVGNREDRRVERMAYLSTSRTFGLSRFGYFFLLHFVLSWQEHLLPLLALDEESMTLPLALTKLRDASFRIPEAVSMAAATLSILPVALMFAVCFRLMKSALREVTHS